MQVVFEDVTAETRRHDLMEAYRRPGVSGQEEERRHIAQELHDGPVQTLIHLCRQIDDDGAQTASPPPNGAVRTRPISGPSSRTPSPNSGPSPKDCGPRSSTIWAWSPRSIRSSPKPANATSSRPRSE